VTATHATDQAVEVRMPRLSDTMEEGTIVSWLAEDGAEVTEGQDLVEIETDKATMTYESDQEGFLQIIAGEGATLAVGEPIGSVGPDSDGAAPAAAAPAETSAEQPASAERTSDTGIEAMAEAGDSEAAPRESEVAEAGTPASSDGPAAPAAEPAQHGERVKASPLARRIARQRGLDLQGISGSGPGGRIVKADVLGSDATKHGAGAAEPGAAAQSGGQAAAGATAEVATAKGQATEVELTRTQQTIARRMAESKATIPDFSIQTDVDMEACVALRSELKRLAHPAAGEAPATQPTPPTYNDMVVKACALALREHARANGSYRDGRLQLYSRINVGVAVAAEDALVVPTVFDAEEKSLGEIARETRALADRVRGGTITPPELGGGTFTVSNLGMYGIRSFSAIINPPQAGILSVGLLEPRAVVRDGEIVARNTMTLTLVCDHRILYGAEAAQFLARVRELLESPTALTL
jgi:pyruvate dehydrogenase E2 component (dihydrolipoamide acetyltransferase)